MNHLLVLRTSVNGANSYSNKLVDEFVARQRARWPGLKVTERDLNAQPVPPLNDQTVGAIRAGVADTEERRAAIALSDTLVAELKAADAIVIGLPRYNFSVPASFKAYVDYIGRAGVTFKYTDAGPQGLLPDVPVYAFVTSGGAYAGTDNDQMSGWVKQVLGFLGLRQLHLIHAERLAFAAEDGMKQARAQLEEAAAA